MGRPHDRCRSLGALLLAGALAACHGAPTTTSSKPVIKTASPAPGPSPTLVASPLVQPSAGASSKPASPPPGRVVAQDGTPTLLSGTVKLISDAGGGIISDNGSGLISNNGGSILANNGGTLISNNGGSYRLQAVGEEALLAGATVEVYDATGARLTDAQGKPLTATTDAKGAYQLSAVLPAQDNLVLLVNMKRGGQLAALLPHPAAGPRTQDIATATTLGAAYVLADYVKGNQTIYDKLPTAEADALAEVIRAAQAGLDKAPTYQAQDLVALTQQLRTRAPAVDRKLVDIQALLLGQANLGNGRRATQVPLTDARVLLLDPQGALLIGEHFFGRIRKVTPDGTLTTLVDGAAGTYKYNFRRIAGLAPGPQGSFYVASDQAGCVYRVGADGQRTIVAGNGVTAKGDLTGPATGVSMLPWSVATAPDGTLYIGERAGGKVDQLTPPRLMHLKADGTLELVALDPAMGTGTIGSLATDAQGTLYALFAGAAGNHALYRLKAGAVETVTTDLSLGTTDGFQGGLACGPDGTVYVSDAQGHRVLAFGADNKPRMVAGDAAHTVERPAGLAVAPDGTLYICDVGTGRVFSLSPGGLWEAVAGRDPSENTNTLAQIAVNAPGGLGFDAQGRLLVVEAGSNTIKRLDGTALTTVVGTGVEGLAGDGGPATQAQLSAPAGMAMDGGAIYLLDQGNDRLRKIGADGIIDTLVGVVDGAKVKLTAKVTAAPPRQFDMQGLAIAFSPDHQPVWTEPDNNRVVGLRASDGQVVVWAGGSGLPEPTTTAAGITEAGPRGPSGIAFDAAGNLFITDFATMTIDKITHPGTPNAAIAVYAGVPQAQMLSRIAGGTLPNEEGQPAANATLVGPAGLCFDQAGNMYVGEVGTSGFGLFGAKLPPATLDSLPPAPARIRKIAPDGTITTVAGPGGKFFTDPSADDALVGPTGLALDPSGRLVIIDTGANLIRFLPAGQF